MKKNKKDTSLSPKKATLLFKEGKIRQSVLLKNTTDTVKQAITAHPDSVAKQIKFYKDVHKVELSYDTYRMWVKRHFLDTDNSKENKTKSSVNREENETIVKKETIKEPEIELKKNPEEVTEKELLDVAEEEENEVIGEKKKSDANDKDEDEYSLSSISEPLSSFSDGLKREFLVGDYFGANFLYIWAFLLGVILG